MIFTLYVTIFLSLIIFSRQNQTRDIPPLLDSIQGEWYQNHIYQQSLSCNPCQYRILLFYDFVIMELKRPNKVNFDQHNIHRRYQNQFKFLSYEDHDDFVDYQKDMVFHSFIKSSPQDGLSWEFKFIFPFQGIQIEGKIVKNRLLIPLIIIIAAGLSLIMFPFLSKQQLKMFIKQLSYRCNIVSILLTILNLSTILAYCLIIFSSYMFYSQGIISRIACYGGYVISIGIFLIIFITFIRTLLTKLLKLVPNKVYQLVIFLFGIAITFSYPIIISYWPKSQLYLYFCSVPIVIQFIHSISLRKYPYYPYIIFNVLIVFLIMFLQTYIPLLHFLQLSTIQMVRVFIIIFFELLIGTLVGWYLIRKEVVQFLQYSKQTMNQSQQMKEKQIIKKRVISEQQMQLQFDIS